MTNQTSPRYVAIGRDLPDMDIRIHVIDTTAMTVACQIELPGWDEWRPARAGHRLIEHGYMIDADAVFRSGGTGGWTELPGIGYIAPVNQIEQRV